MKTKYKFFLSTQKQMDAGVLGAVIGISVMAGVVLSWKCIDCYKTRKSRKQFRAPLQEEKQPILVVKRQWKMKDLKLPRSNVVNNLSIRKF